MAQYPWYLAPIATTSAVLVSLLVNVVCFRALIRRMDAAGPRMDAVASNIRGGK